MLIESSKYLIKNISYKMGYKNDIWLKFIVKCGR